MRLFSIHPCCMTSRLKGADMKAEQQSAILENLDVACKQATYRVNRHIGQKVRFHKAQLRTLAEAARARVVAA